MAKYENRLTPDDLRPVVRDFAIALESRLRKHDGAKRCWLPLHLSDIETLLLLERDEVDQEIGVESELGTHPDRLCYELVDEAVCCLMAWDAVGNRVGSGRLPE